MRIFIHCIEQPQGLMDLHALTESCFAQGLVAGKQDYSFSLCFDALSNRKGYYVIQYLLDHGN